MILLHLSIALPVVIGDFMSRVSGTIAAPLALSKLICGADLSLIFRSSYTFGIISGDGHCPPKTVGVGGVKMAKHECGLLATVLLRLPAVKADTLVMDYSKMGVVIHMLALINGAVTLWKLRNSGLASFCFIKNWQNSSKVSET